MSSHWWLDQTEYKKVRSVSPARYHFIAGEAGGVSGAGCAVFIRVKHEE